MSKIIRFSKKEIEKYKRRNFSVSVSKKGREILTEKKSISRLKKLNFRPINECTSIFDILDKKVIIKKSLNYIDKFQLRDYFKQKKVVDCVPEIYGVLELKSGSSYIFSRYISNAVDLKLYLKKNKRQKEKIKRKIETIGQKLIAKGLLPFDFQLKQFVFCPRSKKLYLCDNSISFPNPRKLIFYFKKTNLPVPLKLKRLHYSFSLNPIELALNALRVFKKKSTNETLVSILKRQASLIKISSLAQKKHQTQTKKIILETIAFYDALPLDVKQKIQKEILKDCLKEFNYF